MTSQSATPLPSLLVTMSVSLSLSQPASKTALHPVSQPVTKSVTSHSAAKYISLPGNKPASQKDAWLSVEPVIQPVNRVTCYSVNQPVNEHPQYFLLVTVRVEIVIYFSKANIFQQLVYFVFSLYNSVYQNHFIRSHDYCTSHLHVCMGDCHILKGYRS